MFELSLISIKMHRMLPILVACAAGILSGCQTSNTAVVPEERSSADLPPAVAFTVNYPLQYFADRIAGEAIAVEFPAPSDIDPATWFPPTDVVLQYQQADIVFLNGAGYAQWLNGVSLPSSTAVDTSISYQDRLIEKDDCTTHSHGPEGDHSHCGYAFTTWLDPQLATLQAASIRDTFSNLNPDLAEEFEANFQDLAADLDRLDRQLDALLAENTEQVLLFSHPVYDYLIRQYNLDARSLHWEPDEFPDEAQWQAFELLVDDVNPSWMVWEGEPLPQTIERLEAMGIGSVVFDPVANVPETGDFLSVMQDNADRLSAISIE